MDPNDHTISLIYTFIDNLLLEMISLGIHSIANLHSLKIIFNIDSKFLIYCFYITLTN